MTEKRVGVKRVGARYTPPPSLSLISLNGFCDVKPHVSFPLSTNGDANVECVESSGTVWRLATTRF